MHIAVLDDYQDAVRHLACFAKLAGHRVSVFNDSVADVDALAARLADVEALVLIRERTVIGDALLARLPELKLISQTGKISHHLSLDVCSAHGVAVAEGAGSPTAPAELTWALIMATMRRIPQYSEELRRGHWQQSRGAGLGRVLKGQTLGIWSYGKIGRLVAGYGRAFGMNVLVWGRDASRAAAVADGFVEAEDRQHFFKQSDVVSLHLRLNDTTRGMVRAADLAHMKRDALLVNTSRAELVEAGALLPALKAGRPGFAALDVFDTEPLRDSALLHMDNVVCTPHLGYVEQASYELYFGLAFDNVLAFAAGKPANIANPQVLK